MTHAARRAWALLRTSHLQAVVAVTLLTTALAAAVGRGWGTAAVAAAVLAGQLSVGWANDAIDHDRDRRSGRLDKPIVRGDVALRTVWWAAAAALVATVPLSLLSGWRAGLVHIAAVLVGWSYDLGVKATAASPVPFVLAFGSLPAFVALGQPGHPAPAAWAVLAAALLGSGAHFVNALPDLGDDAREGVRGLPHRIGPRASLGLAVAQLTTAAVVVVVAPDGAPGGWALGFGLLAIAGAVGVVVAVAVGRPRQAWALTLLLAVATVCSLLGSADAIVS
jgi:4-hydroxybenzoate polyprenyltransferase